jgi:hypothetical protein
MEMSRRNAIAAIAAATVGALVFRIPGPLVDVDLHEAERTYLRNRYFELVPIWHRMPEGPEKERVHMEAYECGVISGVLRCLRVPEWDRELGLELPSLDDYHLRAAEKERLTLAGWYNGKA